jgi:hypothetical protein
LFVEMAWYQATILIPHQQMQLLFHFWSILPILATIYEVKKKLVEGAPMTYFQIDIF